MVNLGKRYGQKLRRIILRHFGLATSRFHYGRTIKPLIFMISGFSDVSMIRKTNYYVFGDPMIPRINQEQTIIGFGNIIYGTLNSSEIVFCKVGDNTRA